MLPLVLAYGHLLLSWSSFFALLLFIRVSQADIEIKNENNETVDIVWDQELSYGNAFPLYGIKGRLVVSEPETACSAIKGPPSINSTLDWIVLIKKCHCSYQEKLIHAFNANYAAAIIYLSDQCVTLPSTYDDDDSFSIVRRGNNGSHTVPGVLVRNQDGRMLKQQYLYATKHYIIIIPNTPFDLHLYLWPFAVVIGICLLIMVSFMIFQIIKCLRDQRRSRKHRLTKKQLKQIPTTKYRKGDQYDTCAICLEEYTDGEKLRVLPCAHVYHMRCIDPWLTRNRKVCPVCKGKVVLPGMSDESNTESEAEATHTANERTPLIPNTDVGRPQVWRGNRRHRQQASRQSRTRISNIAIVTPMNRGNSTEGIDARVSTNLRSQVQADITPITLAPSAHSVNCDEELEGSGSEPQPVASSSGLNTTDRTGRSQRQDVIV